MTYTLFLIFSVSLDYAICSFFQIIANPPKIFQCIYWKKNVCVSGPTQFKPLLIKGQLYIENVLLSGAT